MTKEILSKVNSISEPGWRHKIDVGGGVITPGREDTFNELDRLQIENNLSGKKLLDIGCSDGFYSFTCEKRGAKVTAIDNFTSSPNINGVNGFNIAASLLNSKVQFIDLSVYDIDSIENEFDIILLVNVLYHLRHPALAIDKIYSKLNSGGKLYLKTHFHQDIRFGPFGFDLTSKPFAKFYESNELNNDPSNWWGLNRKCIEALLRSAGFSQIRKTAIYRDRIYYCATKK